MDDIVESTEEETEIRMSDMNIHQKISIINHMRDAIGERTTIPICFAKTRFTRMKEVIEKDDSIFEDIKEFQDLFVTIFRLDGGDKCTDDHQYIWRLRTSDVYLIRRGYEFELETMEQVKGTILECTKGILEHFLTETIHPSVNQNGYVRYQKKFMRKFPALSMLVYRMDQNACLSRIMSYIPVIDV